MKKLQIRKWCLDVCFPDAVEWAHFESREDAIEHAKAIIDDYDDSIAVVLIDPHGTPEKITPPYFGSVALSI